MVVTFRDNFAGRTIALAGTDEETGAPDDASGHDAADEPATAHDGAVEGPEGELVELAMARVHPTYKGRTKAQAYARLRARVQHDLTDEQFAELTWTVEAYALSASRSAAR